MSADRGFFSVGIWHPKTKQNVGTLWRSAYQLGAAEIFTVAPRQSAQQASDTCKAWRHVPFRLYSDVDDLISHLPRSCPLVGVEMGGEPLAGFGHPERACYLLGAEDHGLSPEVVSRCHSVVSLEAVRQPSFNVAVAGSIVLYDRLFGAAGKPVPS